MKLFKYFPSVENPNIFINIVKRKDPSTNKTVKLCEYLTPLINEYKWTPV